MPTLAYGVDIQHTIRGLSVVRHLPSGTRLERPRTSEERQLLADLVQLTDEQDPITWLQAERGPLSVHIALQAALEQLKSRVVGVQRLLLYGFEVPDEDQQQLLGDLANRPEAPDLFASLEGPGLVSLHTLRSILSRVRQARGDAGEAQVQDGAATTLLAGLLSLADDVEPLHWLSTEQSFLCAVATLRRLLNGARPPLHSLQVGPTVQMQFPRAAVPTSSGIPLVVEEVAFGKAGTRITAYTRINLRNYKGRDRTRIISAEWSGFNQLVDDQGHRYLLQHRVFDTSDRLWWSTLRVRAAFYPAPAPGATTLTFSTDSEFVDIREFQLPSDERSRPTRVLLDQLPLGDIEWQVAVPLR